MRNWQVLGIMVVFFAGGFCFGLIWSETRPDEEQIVYSTDPNCPPAVWSYVSLDANKGEAIQIDGTAWEFAISDDSSGLTMIGDPNDNDLVKIPDEFWLIPDELITESEWRPVKKVFGNEQEWLTDWQEYNKKMDEEVAKYLMKVGRGNVIALYDIEKYTTILWYWTKGDSK